MLDVDVAFELFFFFLSVFLYGGPVTDIPQQYMFLVCS